MNEELGGLLFIAFGLWFLFAPKSALDFKVRWAKLFGAKISYSKRTEKYYQYCGVAAIIIGALILFG